MASQNDELVKCACARAFARARAASRFLPTGLFSLECPSGCRACCDSHRRRHHSSESTTRRAALHFIEAAVSSRSCGGVHARSTAELDGAHDESRNLTHACLPSRGPNTSGIEDLREKREEINQQIVDENDEKSKVESDLTVLSKRLTTLKDSIARKVRQFTASSLFTASVLLPHVLFRVFLTLTCVVRLAEPIRPPHRNHRPPRGTITIRRFRRRKRRT